MDLQLKIKAYSLKHQLLSAGDRILLAVSGGPDSMALLHLLQQIKTELSLHLEIAHLEHGIRGEEARSDAVFVQQWAERLELPCHVKSVSIPHLISHHGGNVEEMARLERYRFFTEVALHRGLSKVATAHTQDDQTETVLMWLFRGAGRKGLGGIAPRQIVRINGATSAKELSLIRPLLCIAKDELLQLLECNNLDFRLDTSNSDTGYLRNWLRGELVPRLKERIDRRLPSRLAQLSEVFRDEAGYLERIAEEELDRLCVKDSVSRMEFLSRPTALQRHVLRTWIKRRRGHLRGIDFEHIEALLTMICNGSSQGRLAIPGGWELTREYDKLRLVKAIRRTQRVCYAYPLMIDEAMEVPEANMTIKTLRTASSGATLPLDPFEAVFDLAVLTAPLVVRNFRRGDRFQPLGMTGHKKIKELFIEKKVPLSRRAIWPLLVMGAEILWVPGYGRSEIARIGPNSREFLRLTVMGRGSESQRDAALAEDEAEGG